MREIRDISGISRRPAGTKLAREGITRPGRIRAKRRKIVFDRLALLLALCGALLLLLSQVTNLKSLQVRDIIVEGNSGVQDNEIEKVVEVELKGYYLNLFSRGNLLLFSRNRIEEHILKKFPRVLTAEVLTKDLHNILISIEERAPIGIWCEKEDDNTCFYIDEKGYIYAKAPHFTGSLNFTFTGELKGSGEPIGNRFLTEEEFSGLNEFISLVREAGVDPKLLKISAPDVYELFVDDGARIIFDPSDGYAPLLENLRVVLESNEFRSDAGDRLLLIDYIDLRFGNKVFYKFE